VASIRSLLFIPADSEKKLAKGDSVPADVLILDLEDAVAPENKAKARQMARDYLLERPPGRERQVWIRINTLDNPAAGADLAAVMPGGPDGIVLPKARSADDVILLGNRIGTYETEHELPPNSTRVLPVATETAASLFTLGDYRRAGQRLAGLTWGAEDLSAAIGATTNKDASGRWTSPFELARSLCLFGAHAAGVQAIDTLYSDFRDDEGLRASCEAARRDGFSGKLAIHPGQVEIINQAFTPSEAEVEQARRIVALFAENPGVGALSLDGRMVDQPHLTQAKKILAAAGEQWGQSKGTE
jgi:citrate lyase subunit beta/citryl-CoA lyase